MKTTITLASLVAALVLLPGRSRAQQHFPSPQAAAKALASALRARDAADRVQAMLGPDSADLVSSGDPVDDAAARRRVLAAASERNRIELTNDGATAILHLGRDDWPFPIPLAKEQQGWRFDTAAGTQEVLNRRIGRNELVAISVCRAYVDAQRAYAARFKTFAQTVRSSPGQRDGLYWEAAGGDASPLGPFVAYATGEGYQLAGEGEAPRPYHGYFFRILRSQGPHAPGGARDYVKDGRMTGGFALLAWPATHGSSGVMTFMVGREDVVFEKNLGEQTAEAVKSITAYDPDGSWHPVR